MRKRKSGLPFSMPEKGTDRSILLCVKFEPVALDISMCETANFFSCNIQRENISENIFNSEAIFQAAFKMAFFSAFLISCLRFHFSRVCGKERSGYFDFQTIFNGILMCQRLLGKRIGLQKSSIFWLFSMMVGLQEKLVLVPVVKRLKPPRKKFLQIPSQSVLTEHPHTP